MSVMKSTIVHTIQISVVVLALLCHMMLSSAWFLYLDDVYVGMLANESGVIAVDHSGFYMPIDDYDDCIFVPNALVQHRATGQCSIKLLRMHGKDFPYGTNLGSFL